MPQAGYKLNLTVDQAQRQVKSAIMQEAEDRLAATVKDAAAASPRETGRNAESLNYSFKQLAHTDKGVIFGTSGYSGWLEIGTKKMPARPYVYPAAVSNLGAIAEGVAVRLK